MEIRFRQERNRASILLSLIRTRLTSSEYRSLLLVQNWADQWFYSGGLSSEECSLWVSELKARLDDLYQGLEEGRLSPPSGPLPTLVSGTVSLGIGSERRNV